MVAKRSYTHLIFLLALLHPLCLAGQSKAYLWIGNAGVGAINRFGYGDLESKYFSGDLEYEKEFAGSINLLTGLSFFNAGYETGFSGIALSNYSYFRAFFVGLPLMARWNVGNTNSYLIDLGFVPYYMLDAQLEEGVMKFGRPHIVRGNITEFSRRLYFAYKLQMTILVNRFAIGLYFLLPGRGQPSLNGLEDHWGLNAQQSIYLGSNGFSNFYIVGLRVGVRIL